MATKQMATDVGHEQLIRQLRELIAALDARVPHLERTGETLITDEAIALRAKALRRLADIERKQ
jgi:hypothetical protein